MQLPSDPAEQIPWFHELAALPVTELEALSAQDVGKALTTFIECQLPGEESLSGLTHDELFQAVRDLRIN